jgi:hypothetical protein
MTVDDALEHTRSLWRRGAHLYGQSDCLLSVADYGQLLSGVDIGAPWRGTYDSEAAALGIVADAGGAVPLLGGALISARFVPVDNPGRGDALVVLAGHEVGAIHLGQRIAMRLPRGMTEIRTDLVRIVSAWRFAG